MKQILYALILLFFIAGCSKDEAPDDSNNELDDYLLVTIPSFVSPVSYIQTFSDLNTSSLDNSNAQEYLTGGFYKYNNMYFSCNYIDNYIVRFLVNDNNQFVEDVKIDLGGTTGRIWFKDANTAYSYETTGFQVKIFDPTNMVITGNIDLSMLKREDVPFMELYDVIERDNKLFIPLALSIQPHSQALDSVHVALIDLSSNSFEKVIKSGVSQTVGAGLHSKVCIVLDEQGDIYFTAHLSSGLGGSDKPSGLMRIKSGETEFDTTYFWNLTEATNDHRAEAFLYLGNGKAIIAVGYSELADPNNTMTYILDPIWKWWYIDMNTETAIDLDLPYTKAFNSGWIYKHNNEFLLPVANNDEQAIYKLDMDTRTVTGKIETDGIPISFLELEK